MNRIVLCVCLAVLLSGCSSLTEKSPVTENNPTEKVALVVGETPPAEKTPAVEEPSTGEEEPMEEIKPGLPSETLPLGIIGEEEPVYIENIPDPLQARIDTGASLCSLDVTDIQFFERDGKSWVSFKIKHRTSNIEYSFEKKIKRKVKIKRHGIDDPPFRPLVELKIRIGRFTLLRDFTLIDRSHFDYQVLIGRNLLKGLAAVDVSLNNTLAE